MYKSCCFLESLNFSYHDRLVLIIYINVGNLILLIDGNSSSEENAQ